jgi:hypothetical protein
MKVQRREAVVGIMAVALAGGALVGAAVGSMILMSAAVVALLLLIVGLLLAVMRQVSLRATGESVTHLRKRVDQLAVTTATDAAANHREVLAVAEKLAGEARPRT